METFPKLIFRFLTRLEPFQNHKNWEFALTRRKIADFGFVYCSRSTFYGPRIFYGTKNVLEESVYTRSEVSLHVWFYGVWSTSKTLPKKSGRNTPFPPPGPTFGRFRKSFRSTKSLRFSRFCESRSRFLVRFCTMFWPLLKFMPTLVFFFLSNLKGALVFRHWGSLQVDYSTNVSQEHAFLC